MLTVISAISFVAFVACIVLNQHLTHRRFKRLESRADHLEAALAACISDGSYRLIESGSVPAAADSKTAATAATATRTRSDRVIRLTKELVAVGNHPITATGEAARIVDQEMHDEAKRQKR